MTELPGISGLEQIKEKSQINNKMVYPITI